MSEVLQLLPGEGNQSHHSQHSNFLPTRALDALPSEVAGIFHRKDIHLTVRQLPPQHLPIPSRKARAVRCPLPVCRTTYPKATRSCGPALGHHGVNSPLAWSPRHDRTPYGDPTPGTSRTAPARNCLGNSCKARPGGRASAGEAVFSHPNCISTWKFLLAPTPRLGIKTSKPAESRQSAMSRVTASPRQMLSSSLQRTQLL